MNKEHENLAVSIARGLFGEEAFRTQVEMGMQHNLVDGLVDVGEPPTAFGVLRDAMRDRQVLFEFYSDVADADDLMVAIHKLNEATRRWIRLPTPRYPREPCKIMWRISGR